MYKKITQDSRDFAMFKDIWKLYENYYIPENDDKYWDDLVRAASDYCAKYDNSKLSAALVFAIIDELERKLKAGGHCEHIPSNRAGA